MVLGIHFSKSREYCILDTGALPSNMPTKCVYSLEAHKQSDGFLSQRIGIPVAPSIAPSADSHSILSDESRSMAESRVNPVKSQRFTEMDISTIELQPTNILLPRPRLVADEPFARQLPRPYSWAMYHLRGGDDHVTSVPEAMAAPLQPRHPVPIPLCCCCGSSSPPYWRCISCGNYFNFLIHVTTC